MDPSHARKYTWREIEIEAGRVLRNIYGSDIRIPVDIDLVAEKHAMVDSIIPAPSLEAEFRTAAALVTKANGHCDIFVDNGTFEWQEARASFSIGHELGHVVLHPELYSGCSTIEASVELAKKLKNRYSRIERDAHYFAGAVLIPRRTIFCDAQRVYEALVEQYGYELEIVPSRVQSMLQRRYRVNAQPMAIRLRQIELTKRIKAAVQSQCSDLYIGD